ncbi:hypothetical protein NHX12_030795 [Muraenolepis orangiensis]|uniref:Uncharacterized protein n=1 Tax=Muraenolepis orangiensis TaxID=630683 RepID=A0A9Q0EA74_9TELE|nr:hypothetical protein NHX12_030795 [Muraenolepis orangiensis]
MAVKRENVWGRSAEGDQQESSQPVRAAFPSSEEELRPAWLTEVTELIRAATLQTRHQTSQHPGGVGGVASKDIWLWIAPSHGRGREMAWVPHRGGNAESTTDPTSGLDFPGVTLRGTGPGGQPRKSSPESGGDQARGPIVTVGRGSIGDSCFIVVNVDGKPCTALVDSGDGPVTMAPTNTPGGPPVRQRAAEVRSTETGASCASSGPLAQETPGPKGSPNRTPTENPPAPSQLPGPQPGGDGVRLALKAIWTKNSDHLTASQHEQLWKLLREFKDIFALGEEEMEITHLAQHEIDHGRLSIVGQAKWRQQQEEDPDLQPVSQWVEAQERPPWETVAQLSANTKGL